MRQILFQNKTQYKKKEERKIKIVSKINEAAGKDWIQSSPAALCGPLARFTWQNVSFPYPPAESDSEGWIRQILPPPH